MKHKIEIIFAGDSLESRTESFCESVGFDNVIDIVPCPIDDSGGIIIMIHYKTE